MLEPPPVPEVPAHRAPSVPVGRAARWWVYQRERFPVFAHGLLIAAFSFSALGYSALVRGAAGVGLHAALTAFANSFLAFLQFRIGSRLLRRSTLLSRRLT